MNINELKAAFEAMEAAEKNQGEAYDKLTKAEAFLAAAEKHKVKTSDMVHSTYELWAKGMFVDNTEMLDALTRLHKAEAFYNKAVSQRNKAESELHVACDNYEDAVINWEAYYRHVRDYIYNHEPRIINLMRGPEHVCEILGMEYSRGDRPFDPDALHMITEIRKYTTDRYIQFELIALYGMDNTLVPYVEAHVINMD